MNTFSSRLRQHVKALGLSGAAAARRAGIGERQFHNYLSGHREPDFTTLVQICERLGAEPNLLLGFTASDTAPPERASIIAGITGVLPSLSLKTLRSVSGIVGVLAAEDRPNSSTPTPRD